MSDHRSRWGADRRHAWLTVALAAAVLGLSAPRVLAQADVDPGTTSPSPTLTPITNPTALEVPILNQALTVERLLARFYAANIGQPYLTGTGAVTTPPATTPPTTNPPATTPPTTNPPTGTPPGTYSAPDGGFRPLQLPAEEDLAFTATLSGSAMVPPVNTSASGTARFILRRDRRAVDYRIETAGLSSPVTEIHLHQANAGQPGGIIHHILANPVNGVSSGRFGIRPEELDPFQNGGIFLEIHTQQNPLGELRGQVTLEGPVPPGTDLPPGTDFPPGTVFPPDGGTGVARQALQQMVLEFQSHHNAHVAVLEQSLGTSAQPAPTFQNVIAPTLTQFLTTAIALEEFAAGTHQFLVISAVAGTTPSARVAQLLVAMGLDDSRHVGALRAYRKIVSTAEGGDPGTFITEEGALPAPRTQDQINAFLQPYLVAPGTTPSPDPGTQPPGGTSPTF